MSVSMAFIEIKRVCKECEKTRAALSEAMREVDQIRLDYHNLYEKVRTNLAKLSKRADEKDQNGPDIAFDPMAQARTLLLQRKLNRG